MIKNDNLIMKTIQVIDDSVKNFVNEIVAEIKNIKFTTDVDVDFCDAESECLQYKSISCIISTDLGTVAIFPNFVKNSSSGAIFNYGLENRYISEGFDEESIDKEARVWTNIKDYSSESTKVFANYLTTKLI